MRHSKYIFALILALMSTHTPQDASAKGGECVENKAEAIANHKAIIRDMQAYLKDDKRIKKLANSLKESGKFSNYGEASTLEMERKARDLVASHIEQAKEQLSSLRSTQDCSEHGATKTRFCIENKSDSIEKTESNIQHASKILSKPVELVHLADQLILAQDLGKNMSQQEKIELATRFIREQIMTYKQKLITTREHPDCSEPGAIRRCTNNRSAIIQQASEIIKESNEILSKPEQLEQLADSLIFSQGLPKNLSQQKKINLARSFVRQQIPIMREQLSIFMKRPACTP